MRHKFTLTHATYSLSKAAMKRAEVVLKGSYATPVHQGSASDFRAPLDSRRVV